MKTMHLCIESTEKMLKIHKSYFIQNSIDTVYVRKLLIIGDK